MKIFNPLKDFLSTTAKIKRWQKANEIKEEMEKLYKENPILTKGWNFVSITPYLVFSTNDEEKFLGDCKEKIIKSYSYKTDSKEWIPLETHNLDSLMYGAGAIIKVSSDCTLGTPTGDETSPPTIPD